MPARARQLPDPNGYFEQFGGRFIPETLMPALNELEAAYTEARADSSFQEQFHRLCQEYIGRPTPLYLAEQLSARVGGATILALYYVPSAYRLVMCPSTDAMPACVWRRRRLPAAPSEACIGTTS